MLNSICSRLHTLVSALVPALCLFISLFPQPVHAYIGPGLSVGAAIVVLIVVFSILLALYALVWFPLKRRIKAKRESAESVDS